MPRKARVKEAETDPVAVGENSIDEDGVEDVVLDGTLVCALTGEHKTATPQEETLQSFIEQLHGEYGVDLPDMERDVRVECVTGEEGGRARTKTRTVQLAVYEHGKPHEVENIIRAVLVAKPGVKADQNEHSRSEANTSYLYGWTTPRFLGLRPRWGMYPSTLALIESLN